MLGKGCRMTPQGLKAIRKALNLTTAELGERLGVSGRTVEDWEQGRRKVRGPAERLLNQLVEEPIPVGPEEIGSSTN